MASIQRVMVVDAKNRLGATVRTVMSLLDRRYILLEIPTVEAALAEISLSNLNLLVTGYKADGSMNGIDFAQRAIREQAGLPILMLGEEDDPSHGELDDVLGGIPSIQYIEYPYEERLLRGLRIGLDGADIVAAEEGTSALGLDLGEVPPIDIDKVRTEVIATLRELSFNGCMGGFVSDRVGRIVIDEATGYVDKAMIAATFGPEFANATKISTQVGGNSWSMKYYDGPSYDLFALALGFHYFVVFIFDGTKRPAWAAITRFGREGADKIINVMGDAAWSYHAPEAKPKRQVTEKVAIQPHETSAKAAAPVKVEKEEPPAPKIAEFQLQPVENFDINDILAGDVDGELDLLDDSLDFSFSGDPDSIGFEDARNMGLLD